MANFGRMLGVNIDVLMRKMNVSPEMFAKQLGCSDRDIHKIIEGKVMLPPSKLALIAEKLNTTVDRLIEGNDASGIPELQYMTEFKDLDNLDRVLDLIDEYVELKEAI